MRLIGFLSVILFASGTQAQTFPTSFTGDLQLQSVSPWLCGMDTSSCSYRCLTIYYASMQGTQITMTPTQHSGCTCETGTGTVEPGGHQANLNFADGSSATAVMQGSNTVVVSAEVPSLGMVCSGTYTPMNGASLDVSTSLHSKTNLVRIVVPVVVCGVFAMALVAAVITYRRRKNQGTASDSIINLGPVAFVDGEGWGGG